jgi:hypothetical protein
MEEHLNKDTNLETLLQISIGVKVVFTSNQIGTFVANNGFGTVVEISDSFITVMPHCKEGIVPQAVTVSKIVKESLFKGVKVSRRQFPIKLSYASTINAAIGMTFYKPATVLINHLRLNKNGHSGFLYTALSRIPDHKFIKFLFPVKIDDFTVNETALNFDLYHRNNVDIITDVDYTFSANGQMIHNSKFSENSKLVRTNAYVPTAEAKIFVEANLDQKDLQTLRIKRAADPTSIEFANLERDILNNAARSALINNTVEAANLYPMGSIIKKKKTVSYEQIKISNNHAINEYHKKNINNNSDKASVNGIINNSINNNSYQTNINNNNNNSSSNSSSNNNYNMIDSIDNINNNDENINNTINNNKRNDNNSFSCKIVKKLKLTKKVEKSYNNKNSSFSHNSVKNIKFVSKTKESIIIKIKKKK